MPDLWLVFPLGPGKNDLHGVGTARWGRWLFLKPEVREWRQKQRARLRAEDIVEHEEPCSVEVYSHYLPGSSYGDVDHQLVNILDTLTSVDGSSSLLKDDKWIWRVTATVTRDAPADEPYVDVFVLWGADESPSSL